MSSESPNAEPLRKNDRLEGAMVAAGHTPESLGEVVRADPKTVRRWIGGRTPFPHNQRLVAALLDAEVGFLWPEIVDPDAAADDGEVIASYAHRGKVPSSLWRELVTGPTTTVSVLVYAGLPYFENDPEVVECLLRRADDGVKTRLALGDPDCAAVALRGREENIDMAGRIRNSLRLIEPLVGHPGIEVRLHETTLYNSLYIADGRMLVNQHIRGIPAARAPLMLLRRTPDGARFANYARSFEHVWDEARDYS